MGDIVNLGRARKSRARSDAKSVAAANRAKHGLTKPARALASVEQGRRDAVLDGARLERPKDGGDDPDKPSGG